MVDNCEHYLFYFIVSSISAIMNNIPMLNGTNFKKRKEHIMIVLGCMDLDYALRCDRPADLNETSTNEEKGKGNIREYIMEMSNLVTKLRTFKLELSDDILVHLVLISLPAQFSQFKVSYNTQKEKWTLNELIAQCVQEEDRLKQERIESAYLAFTSGTKNASHK
ncbi:uncharacterized protein LOC132613340 [Lycium barbarum]|uniref:uncharacterized protein LOC132613340 n=1 Tax=Lycium barbarum TaxID=112863 RepID=UPI00293F5514|nr:uncharacterized protein LOC132613340 [Lycium barbarum]